MNRGTRILSIVFVLFAILSAIIIFYANRFHQEKYSVCSTTRSARGTVVIDPGHGGEDGGAVSFSGIPESGVNLAIALKMDQVFGFYGVTPYLLRTSDISLHEKNAQTIREKKISDLHNRVSMIESFPNPILISIHQNTYPNQRLHGAQVFYANEVNSMRYAQLTQEILRRTLDCNNERSAAKIPDTVYIMNHVTCPAILVECGFLSNPEEDKLLQSAPYQIKIALSLTAAWLQNQVVVLETGGTP